MFRETSPVPYCMASLCYMIHYGTYRGAVVGLRGAVAGVAGAQLSAISAYLHTSYLGAQLSASRLFASKNKLNRMINYSYDLGKCVTLSLPLRA